MHPRPVNTIRLAWFIAKAMMAAIGHHIRKHCNTLKGSLLSNSSKDEELEAAEDYSFLKAEIARDRENYWSASNHF
jgi:hypothetical protein